MAKTVRPAFHDEWLSGCHRFAIYERCTSLFGRLARRLVRGEMDGFRVTPRDFDGRRAEACLV